MDENILKELAEYERKLTFNTEGNTYVGVRKCRKICNRNLNIKYTISATEDTIKSFIYYRGNQMLLVVLCKGFKELKVGLDIHKAICHCRTENELNQILETYGGRSGDILHL